MNRAELIREYDEMWQEAGRWETPQRDELACRVIWAHVRAPRSILDVGCGNGRTLRRMREKFPQAELYGIDVSSEAVKLLTLNVPTARFEVGFVEDLEPPEPFEVVSCLGTAEHFIDLDEGLRALRRLTGVFCYLEVPNCCAYSPGVHGYRRCEFGSRQMEWHLDLGEWEERIRAAGFEIFDRLRGPSATYEFIWMLEIH